MAELAHHFAARLRVPHAATRTPAAVALFAFVTGTASIAVMALASWVTRQPLLFPSLGPTAFLTFYAPRSPMACPRNIIFGHLIGVVCGYLSLVLFGLRHAAPALARGIALPWVGAAALSLGLTAGLMILFRVAHPPACATTLIVSLGILPRPLELLTMLVAVGGLSLMGLAINRLAGVPFPVWSAEPMRDKR
jgi:CBS-domain-containing membrane protein